MPRAGGQTSTSYVCVSGKWSQCPDSTFGSSGRLIRSLLFIGRWSNLNQCVPNAATPEAAKMTGRFHSKPSVRAAGTPVKKLPKVPGTYQEGKCPKSQVRVLIRAIRLFMHDWLSL